MSISMSNSSSSGTTNMRNNNNTSSNPTRKLPMRRHSASATRKPAKYYSPTLLIGLSMCGIVLLYASVVVFVVMHHNQTDHNTVAVDPLEEEVLRVSHPHRSSIPKVQVPSLRDHLDEHKQRRQQQQQPESRAEKKKRNPFHKKLDLQKRQFGHNVEPEPIVHNKLANTKTNTETTFDGKTNENDTNHEQTQQHPNPDFVLKAFLEPIHLDDWERTPLPRRTHHPDALKEVAFPQVNSCARLLEQWPVDAAQQAPTYKDAFLPWIHDVFPTHDGTHIQVVAQNLRRCNTGKQEQHLWAEQRTPQASLFQHVPIKRVESDGSDNNTNQTRYRLASHADADPDGLATRFVCRFSTGHETLSIFNFDYDWTTLRKRYKSTFNEQEGGIKSIHTSQLIFQCPVPQDLQAQIASGQHVVRDFATLFLDIIPIRTPPRWGPPKQFLQPKYQDFLDRDVSQRFDPDQAWGKEHILPPIEASGRWQNIPICLPSLMQYENQKEKQEEPPAVKAQQVVTPAAPPEKKHRLVSCLWASAGYATRGNRFAINDGQRRLLEWISYNKIIGFDHFYVYDNSGAFSNETSLKEIADMFPDDVTYIPWPSQICNNNPNNRDSPGERSSQYAAEASCRLRFGPHVDWIGQFDIDEYLIPMGNHTTVPQLLDELEKEDTRIISFGSWRAWPRWAYIDTIVPIQDNDVCWHNEPCFHLSIPLKHTMLQAYNCDRQLPGQKSQVMPAEKQLYRPDYVLQHFIHYSAATTLSELNETEYVKQSRADGKNERFRWKSRGFPDPRQRFGDEITEALMIHTKAVAVQDTSGWERMCHIDNLKLPERKQGRCRLGLPWPYNAPSQTDNATAEGYAYNCFVNEKVERDYIPKLTTALQQKTPHLFAEQQ